MELKHTKEFLTSIQNAAKNLHNVADQMIELNQNPDLAKRSRIKAYLYGEIARDLEAALTADGVDLNETGGA